MTTDNKQADELDKWLGAFVDSLFDCQNATDEQRNAAKLSLVRHTKEAALKARIDELDKSMDSFAKGPDYEFLLRARKRKAELAPSGQPKEVENEQIGA